MRAFEFDRRVVESYVNFFTILQQDRGRRSTGRDRMSVRPRPLLTYRALAGTWRLAPRSASVRYAKRPRVGVFDLPKTVQGGIPITVRNTAMMPSGDGDRFSLLDEMQDPPYLWQ